MAANAHRDGPWVSMDVPILMYHDIAEGTPVPGASSYCVSLARFRRQLDYLGASGRSVLGFSRFLKALQGEVPMPARPVIITFDDGYESFARLASPELKRRGMSACVFLVANAIGKTNYWDAPRGMATKPLMGEAEIRRVIDDGMEIGVHGLDHLDLNTSPASEARREIAESKAILEGRFGVPARVFAYPFGRYNESLFPMLEQAGYLAAVSIFSSEPTVTAQPFAMRRVYVHEGDGPVRFSMKLSKLYARMVAWRDRKRGETCH